MIEFEISEAVLESGDISVGPRGQEELGLPHHPVEIGLSFQSQVLTVPWSSRGRRLGSEQLADELQMWARPGHLGRLSRQGDGLRLDLVEPGRWAGAGLTTGVLEEASTAPRPPAAPDRRRRKRRDLRDLRFRVLPRDEYEWWDGLGIHRRSVDQLAENMADRGWDPPDFLAVRVDGEKLAVVDDFDELLALEIARVDHMPHQEATAIRVLSDMGGRAVLADEVGLGKTIEAGLIIKELILRGHVRDALVLCPASLRNQWQDEMREKFDERFAIAERGTDDMTASRLIMSLQLAQRNKARVASRDWDLVVLDEAHKIAGPNARAGRALLEGLDARYKLFLTATPVQNDLSELYRLVQLLRPGTFASRRDFTSRFVGARDRCEPRDPRALRELVRDVMVRTTRAQAGLDDVTRHAVDVPIQLSSDERTAYRVCSELLREHMSEPGDHLRRRQLAHRLTASPRGLASTAHKIAQVHPDPTARRLLSELSAICDEMGRTVRHRRALELVQEWLADPEKGRALVFTQHTETLEDLLRLLDEAGIEAVPFHGGMAGTNRRNSIERFRRSVKVMVSTDAGAEGINLQFCNCVLNYDLPWNPMRIEQRIGRVHRVTQTRDVHVANFFAIDTVDEAVYHVLKDKLRMFELLFGQVTTILGEVDSSKTFEAEVIDAFMVGSDREMRQRLDALGDRLEAARERTDTMRRAGEGVSAWMQPGSRREQTKEATELRPKQRRSRRQRQKDVERFVRSVFASLGSTEERSAKGFVTFALPEDLRQDFDGRSQIHVAFTPEGLEEHPEAELCAAGSDVFEEVLNALRTRGDLVATVPPPPDPGNEAWVSHEDAVALVQREVLGPRALSGRLIWRVRDAVRGGERIVETRFGEEVEAPPASPPLADGEQLPSSLGQPEEIVRRAVGEARSDLEEAVDESRWALEEQATADRKRLVEHYESEVADLRNRQRDSASARSRLHQLESALDDAKRTSAAEPDVRAHLIALEVQALPVYAVRERWRHEDGCEVDTELEWEPGTNPSYVDAAGEPIDKLTVCSGSHLADADRATSCPRCARRLCTTCVLSECPGCRRSVCEACVDARLCATCANLHPASEEERAALPEELATSGLTISVASDQQLTVLGMSGAQRREIATICDGKIERWVSLTKCEPVEQQIALAAALELGVGDLVVTVVERDGETLPQVGLSVWHRLACAVDVEAPSLRKAPLWSTKVPLGLDRESRLKIVLDALGGAPREPERGGEDAALMRQMIPKHQGVANELRVVSTDLEHRTEITVDGILERMRAGERVDERLTPLTSDSAIEESEPAQHWSPPPDEIARAEASGIKVAVLRLGALHTLAISEGPRCDFFRLAGTQGDATRAALAAALGRSQPVTVCAFTGPQSVSWPVVHNANLVRRSYELASRPAIAGPGDASDAARRHLEISVMVPELTELPEGLRQGLAGRFVHTTPSETIALDLAVSETWELEGRTQEVRYTVPAGTRAALLPVVDRDEPSHEATFDRSAHLAAAPLLCPYCGTLSCRECSGSTRPCTVCRIEVCQCEAEEAVSGELLCPACASLEPQGWLRRRLHHGGAASAFVGIDRLHRVTVAKDGDWTLEIDGVGQSGAARLSPKGVEFVEEVMVRSSG